MYKKLGQKVNKSYERFEKAENFFIVCFTRIGPADGT